MPASSNVPEPASSSAEPSTQKRAKTKSAKGEPLPSKPEYPVEQYHPSNENVPPVFLPNPEYMVTLDQGEEGSAVGHGMAAMINYMLHERGIQDQVSARMLQQMSKLYGGAPLDVDQGSILHDGLRAWFEKGVCSASLWPYRAGEWGELTPERERAALKYKPEKYFSVPKDVRTMQAAIWEHHAVVAGATVHDGWFSAVHNGKGEIVPFTGKEHVVGGHAFGILGYTEKGFIVQNAWGAGWGGVEVNGHKFPGCLLWTYPDFQKNYEEGFVGTLPASLNIRPRLRRAGYQSDAVEGTDFLDIRSDVEAVCAVLTARDVKPPLALGLFGNWGTGKSFFMAQMYDEINALAKLERDNPGLTPYCSQVVQIRFNAWHFLDANLWASLVAEIFKNLFDVLSRPGETPQGARRRVIRELGKARGLYRQSQMELESAKQEQQQAQTALQEKRSEVRAQENTLRSIGDQLSRLLETEPAVRQELDKVAGAIGEPALAQSYQALRTQTEQLQTLGGSIRELVREIARPEGRVNRLILLVVFSAACALIFWTAHHLHQLSGVLGQLQPWINSISGLLFGMAAWLAAQIRRTSSIVGGIRRLTRRVDTIRSQRLNELTADEQQELETRRQAEQQAKTRVDEAKQRVDSLQTELEQLNPSRQLQTFIRERSGSEDYRKQLGLVSLVRRDFERLSELLALNEAIEDRWYKRKAQAELATKPYHRPRRSILPMRRIVLYIDDLDRCQPDRVVEVLEAVHLLLAFPLFVVVVAVDPRWLRECLEMHYPRLLATSEKEAQGLTTPSTPQDYLEKIFQIPFYLRPISGRGYRNMIDGLTSPDLDLGTPSSGGTEAEQPVGGHNAEQQPSVPGVLNVRRPDTEKTNSTSASERSDVRIKINPEKLKFRQWEVNDMKRLARIFRTPRAVKRFVNTYRLIRVSIPEVDMIDFIGSASVPGNYRRAQILLAVVCGYPNAASVFLQLLLTRADKPGAHTWGAFLESCSKMHPANGSAEASSAKKERGANGRRPKTGEKEGNHVTTAGGSKVQIEDRAPADFGAEWHELCEALMALDKEFAPKDLSNYLDLALRVARFSFSVSELPE